MRIKTFTDDSLAAIKRDHEKLRYEVSQLRVMLRAFRCDLDEGGGVNAVAVTEVIIPKRVGTTPGGPVSVQKMKIDDPESDTPELVEDGDPVDCWSWIKSDSSDPENEDDGKLYIFVETDEHGVTWFTGQDCPTGGSTEE